jgi:hypothetical protein
MKTSLTDTIRTERFLRGELADDDRLAFNARLLVDQELRRNLFFQRMVHRLVALYHRRKLKAQLEGVHERLLNDPASVSFRESVIKYFNP